MVRRAKEAMTNKRAHKGRPSPISYRPPQGQADEFHARVAASGLSTNAFITACIFGRSPRRPCERQLLARLLDQTAQIADHLDALSHGGADRHALLLDAMQHELAELRSALLALMGRKS
jgi:hypothetical protein